MGKAKILKNNKYLYKFSRNYAQKNRFIVRENKTKAYFTHTAYY